MSSSPLAVIDLTPWFEGDAADRAQVAAAVDAALRDVGFLLVTGHGVPAPLRDAVRSRARAFFALPEATKRRYAATVGGRGWLPPGVEANAHADPYSGGEVVAGAPDLKETFAVGADRRTGDPAIDEVWFPRNVWPDELPELAPVVIDYLTRMRQLSDELLRIAAAAIGLGDDEFFTRHTAHATYTMNLNRYPPLAVTGAPGPEQFRIGPHTDFGTVTVLDREPGRGGLQVWTEAGGWADAPYVPGALTINTGDLLARWSGDRWRSNRHRVLPPQAEAPDEDLVSLVFFYECDADTVVESLQPPHGRANDYPPVVSGAFIQERLDAISVG